MSLQRELKKKRPFESLEQEATLNVLRTNDQFQIRFSRLLRPLDLTPSQYNILRILRGEGVPLPILEIARPDDHRRPRHYRPDRPAGERGVRRSRAMCEGSTGDLRGPDRKGAEDARRTR